MKIFDYLAAARCVFACQQVAQFNINLLKFLAFGFH